jgi:hypothetical protein
MGDGDYRVFGEPEGFVAELFAFARDRFRAGTGFADEREHSKFHKASVGAAVGESFM